SIRASLRFIGLFCVMFRLTGTLNVAQLCVQQHFNARGKFFPSFDFSPYFPVVSWGISKYFSYFFMRPELNKKRINRVRHRISPVF
ncbi:hypothetical protein LJC23_07215, partial [Desulfovibrio sp. OttesenSCG-928-I05]|nr:hypothetical protein [Desulfovibrio sp. OttesenSCG-928-I05]